MNLDANIQKLLTAILRKWKLVAFLAVVGAIMAGLYTANFTTLTYSSSVEFLAYSQDSRQELADSSTAAQQASNTSKMNYAIKMLNTYIELFKTNEFNQAIAEKLNSAYGTSYSASRIRGAISYSLVEDTTMFKVVVTTTDPELSYQIAHQLETSIPEKMRTVNNGLVMASVEDKALKATTSESLGYAKKCIIGFLAGGIIAAAYIILRDLLDIRIKSSDELNAIYGIPVLGTIPEFDLKAGAKQLEKKAKDGREI